MIDFQDNLIDDIATVTEKSGNPFIIAVTGGSATCKSTFVVPEIIRNFGLTDYEIISQDDFQQGWNSKSHYDLEFGHDIPEYFETRACFQTLQRLKNGEPAYVPVYNFQKGMHTGKRIINPKPVIIFEGLFAAHGELSSAADHIIYVESPLYARIIRRMIRNRYERYQVPPAYTFKGVFKVIKAHNALVVKQKEKADQIIQVTFSFQDTIDRFNLKPIDFNLQNAHIVYTFAIPQQESIKIIEINKELRFLYLFQDKVFIEFPITHELFSMMENLNFNNW